MNVIISTHSMLKTSGGPAFGLAKMCEGFAEVGIDVWLVTRKSSDNVLPCHAGVRVLEYKYTIMEVVDSLPKNDVVWYDNGVWHFVNARVASLAKKYGIPRFVHPRGGVEPWVFKRKPWKKMPAWYLYQKRDLQTATGVVVSSELEEKGVLKLVDVKTHVIANAIDLESVYADLSIVKKERVMLFLSRIHPKKGIDYLLKAWANLDTAGWVLKIAGTDLDGYAVECRGLASSLGLKNVEFCGAVFGDEKRALFEEASYFVLPSHSENFGNVVAEAMAAGAVVITTQGTPWGFIHGDFGWCIPLGVDSLQGAIAAALQMPSQEREDKARRAQQHALENYAWKMHVQKLADLFSMTLRRHHEN